MDLLGSLNNSRIRELAMEKLILEKLSSLAEEQAAIKALHKDADGTTSLISSQPVTRAPIKAPVTNSNNANRPQESDDLTAADVEDMLDSAGLESKPDGRRSYSIDSSAEGHKSEKKYQFFWIFKANQNQLKQSQERLEDMQAELDNAKRNITDLIMEIEAVSAEENNARLQNGRLLVQISDCQSMQRVALEENLKLQNEVEHLKNSRADIEAK